MIMTFELRLILYLNVFLNNIFLFSSGNTKKFYGVNRVFKYRGRVRELKFKECRVAVRNMPSHLALLNMST